MNTLPSEEALLLASQTGVQVQQQTSTKTKGLEGEKRRCSKGQGVVKRLWLMKDQRDQAGWGFLWGWPRSYHRAKGFYKI